MKNKWSVSFETMSSFLWLLFVGAFLPLVFTECKKEHPTPDDKTLILGRWTGIQRFDKLYTTDYSNNFIFFGDSAKAGVNGSYFWVEFKKDSVISVFYKMWNTVIYDSLPEPKYALDNRKLTYECSRFTTRAFWQSCVDPQPATIKELTEHHLVISEVDTTSTSPLTYHIVQFEYYR